MVPFLFLVPLTLKAFRGFAKSWITNPWDWVKFWLMNIPPAPVSSKAFALMVLSLCSSKMGNKIDLLTTSATRTLEIYMDGGDTDVEAGSHFKNPGYQQASPPVLPSPWLQVLWYGCLNPWQSISSVCLLSFLCYLALGDPYVLVSSI